MCDGDSGGLPVGQVTEDVAVGAPAVELGHGGDDRVVGERPVAAGVDLARHEIATDGVERRRPAADPDQVSCALRLEPLVVADGKPIVLGLVADEVDPETRLRAARQAPVVIDGLVADGAARQLGRGPRRLAVRQAAATTEAAATLVGWRPALEADGADHRREEPCAGGGANGPAGRPVRAVDVDLPRLRRVHDRRTTKDVGRAGRAAKGQQGLQGAFERGGRVGLLDGVTEDLFERLAELEHLDRTEDDHDVLEPGSRHLVHLVRFVGQHVTDQAAACAGDGGPHGAIRLRAVRGGEVSRGCLERTARTITPSAVPDGPFGPWRPSSCPQPSAWLYWPQMASGCQRSGSPRIRRGAPHESVQPVASSRSTGCVLDDQSGTDALRRAATDTAGMQDRLGILEAWRDGRTAAPRRPDDEAPERPVFAHEAARRLGRRERLQQVPPVLAGRERRKLGHRREVGRLERPDPRVDRLVTQPGSLQDAIPGWTSNPIFS